MLTLKPLNGQQSELSIIFDFITINAYHPFCGDLSLLSQLFYFPYHFLRSGHCSQIFLMLHGDSPLVSSFYYVVSLF